MCAASGCSEASGTRPHLEGRWSNAAGTKGEIVRSCCKTLRHTSGGSSQLNHQHIFLVLVT